MNTRKIIGTIIDSGRCKHYSEGTTFTLDGHRSECMCEMGYREFSVMAKGLLNALRLPGIDNDLVVTYCPYLILRKKPLSYERLTTIAGARNVANHQHY